MTDIGNPETILNFEPKPNPVSTHNNWVMRKLEDYTMARERSIKGETMGFEWTPYLASQLGFMFEAALANEAKSIGETGQAHISTFYPFLVSYATVLYGEVIKPYFEAKRIKKSMTGLPTPSMTEVIKKMDKKYPPIGK